MTNLQKPTRSSVGSQSRGPSANIPIMGSVLGMTKKSYSRNMKIGNLPAIIVPSATRSHFNPQSGNLISRINRATVGIAVLRAGMKAKRRDSITKFMGKLGSR